MDGGPSGHQAGAVERLELVEPGAVHHPGQDLAGVEGDLGVGRGDAQELARVVDRLVGRLARARPALAPVEPAHDLAAQPDGVDLVRGQVVGQAGHPGVHGGAAQLLVGRLLAGGHLDQWRSAEEDLGALLDHHDVVAHARDVGAAGRGVAEDQGHGGQGRRRAAGEVPEGPPAGDEQLGLGGQVGAARLDQVDDRQPVLEGDVRGAGSLAEGEGVHGPAPHRRVVGRDEALDPFHHADPDDRGRPDRVLGAPGGQRGAAPGRRSRGRPAARSAPGPAACPGPGAAARSVRHPRPGPRPAARRPGRPPLRGRARWPGRSPSSGRRWWGGWAWAGWWALEAVLVGPVCVRAAGSHCPGRRGKNRPHELCYRIT